jgi:5-methylcytosine-specific restriction endonuclease McrA
VTPSLRNQIIDRDGDQCWYCRDGSAYLTIDHVVPVSEGGTNELSNLRAACRECNAEKGSRSEDDFRTFTLPQLLYRKRRLYSKERQAEIVDGYRKCLEYMFALRHPLSEQARKFNLVTGEKKAGES